ESATKLEYDLFYIQNLSPRLDLIVIAKTLLVAVLGDVREVDSSREAQGGVPIQPEVS
ncbi:MAG: Bacterial sugar transferase, partial [Pseudomonadota bacterium]